MTATLVTGGAGYIGSHMVLALLDAGRKVVVLDDLSAGVAWRQHGDARFVKGDCGDAGLVSGLIEAEGINAIVHFAGSIVVPDSVSNPLAYYANNTVKSRQLIETAIACGVTRFIFSSTAAVYGDAGFEPIREDAPLAPMSPYGSSKMMTEIMLRDASAAHSFRYVALRYFNVAGADPAARSGQSSPVATHLIKVASQAAVGERNRLDVYGDDYPTPDGTCLRDYIHVDDLAAAHLRALAHLEAGGASDIMNCGYGRGYSVRDVIASVKRVSGSDFPVHLAPRRAGDPASLVAATGRIAEILDWRPRLDDLDTIVSHALAWEKKLRHLGGRVQAEG